jgi:hypothetical protein
MPTTPDRLIIYRRYEEPTQYWRYEKCHARLSPGRRPPPRGQVAGSSLLDPDMRGRTDGFGNQLAFGRVASLSISGCH